MKDLESIKRAGASRSTAFRHESFVDAGILSFESIKTGEKMVEPLSGLKKVMNNRVELARKSFCQV